MGDDLTSPPNSGHFKTRGTVAFRQPREGARRSNEEIEIQRRADRIYALRLAESGTPVVDVCRQIGVSEATYYTWKKKFGDLGVTELKRLSDARGADLSRAAGGACDGRTTQNGDFQCLEQFPFNGPAWAFELKNDGYRMLAEFGQGRVDMRTRGGHDCAAWFPDVAEALARFKGGPYIVDGEVCVMDDFGRSDFDRLQDRARRRCYYPDCDPGRVRNV